MLRACGGRALRWPCALVPRRKRSSALSMYSSFESTTWISARRPKFVGTSWHEAVYLQRDLG